MSGKEGGGAGAVEGEGGGRGACSVPIGCLRTSRRLQRADIKCIDKQQQQQKTLAARPRSQQRPDKPEGQAGREREGRQSHSQSERPTSTRAQLVFSNENCKTLLPVAVAVAHCRRSTVATATAAAAAVVDVRWPLCCCSFGTCNSKQHNSNNISMDD